MSALTYPVLALDASTEVCSVALSMGSEVLFRDDDTPRTHAKVLLPMIDDVLHEGGLKLADVAGLAVSIGPGSFTGIRICMGVAQGLAFGQGLPMFGCNSLALLAQGIRRQHEGFERTLAIPALDARMGELYWAAYLFERQQMQLLVEPRVSAPDDFNRAIEQLADQHQGLPFIGGGHGWGVDGVIQGLFDCHQGLLPRARDMLDLMIHPDMLISLDVMAMEPLYLRNEVAWEKRKRIRDTHL